ncbi:MAG: flagellar biosynthesis protein FlhF [Lachnospiraceae bacterium]|nr:flagellar biosynthesis protein FlhF [Lachnospiraceae bacterium]
MLIKKYVAPTEQEALEKAKAELGKDVIITHITTVKPKGLFKLFKSGSVEVTASVETETDFQKKNANIAARATANAYAKNANDFAKAAKSSGFDAVLPKEEEKTFPIEQVLDSLQNILDKQTTKDNVSQEAVNRVEPEEKPESPSMTCIKMVYNKLLANEVEEVYANKLIAEIESVIKPDSDVKSVLSNIYQKLVLKLGQTQTIKITEGKTRFIFFIGPTGVGKTTTIAKLASSLKLGLKAKVALFTADTYRLAAIDQLRSYASILNIPLKVIYSEAEMKEAMEDFSGYDAVLIDTAGRTLKNKEQRDDIEKLIFSVPEEKRDVYLVLSATTKYKDLVTITEGYSEISAYNLIFTKLDETDCIGNILNVRMLTDAPLSYSTNGQNVPDDISRINPQSIAKQLLGGVE